MRNVTVFRQSGIYAGWPANHGSWQWEDEFLVGFLRGRYKKGGMHSVRPPFQKVQARSPDGGETWIIEEPNQDFEGVDPKLSPHAWSLHGSIIRVSGGYDHGGENAHHRGAFYRSDDRGRTWLGPYLFNGLEEIFESANYNTSRTCVVDNLVFLSVGDRIHWGRDWVFVATHDHYEFRFKGFVVRDGLRAVMPAVAKVGDRLVAVCRRRGAEGSGWIDGFVSDDDGYTWRPTSEVGITGQDNGNPPALIEQGGILYCAFGNRTEIEINVVASEDKGETWTSPRVLRKGRENHDIGYPRLFKRSDGQLVCVYYWANDKADQQHIEATIFKP